MADHNSKKTPEKVEQFLESLRDCGNVALAARFCHIGRRTVYAWRKEDTDFAKAWDEAMEDAVELMEAEARRRALNGVDEPVYQGGRLVGQTRRYSDTLLIFLLKGARPERYRDRWQGELTGPDGGAIPIRFVGEADEPGEG